MFTDTITTISIFETVTVTYVCGCVHVCLSNRNIGFGIVFLKSLNRCAPIYCEQTSTFTCLIYVRTAYGSLINSHLKTINGNESTIHPERWSSKSRHVQARMLAKTLRESITHSSKQHALTSFAYQLNNVIRMNASTNYQVPPR